MSSKFVHLHVHTQYSLLDAVCPIKKLVQKAKDCDMPALAITDNGAMFGVIEFYDQCKKAGIKPIIGAEVYVAPQSRFEKSTHGLQGASYPLVLLCKNDTGYRNLIQLVSIGYLEGFYYRPRIDKEVLRKYQEGLVCLSGGIRAEIPHLVNIGQVEKARQAVRWYKDTFGEDYFLEILHSGLREQERANPEIIALGKELGVELVAACDVHYLERDQVRAYEALGCILTQNTLDDPKRARLQTEEFYFKTPQDIEKIFEDTPDAIAHTLKIADRCNLELDFTKTYVPKFTPPQGKPENDYFTELVWEGVRGRYPKMDAELQKRVEHELSVIQKSGYVSYFLIVWDFVRFAKERNIPVGPGRGSAAGSVVSYCLGITDIDPLRYGLLFERFLNPERVTMPDIDIDFCYEHRDEVIEYVRQKYSVDNVAQIITFGTMMAKAVIRDVGRVMGIAYSDVDKIAKMIPTELDITIEDAMEREPELKKLYKSDPRITQLIDTSRSLEGLTRHASTHAAGVVISDKPLKEHVPLFRSSDGQISTQYAMESLERIGLLKMDFLGLRTLTVIDDTVKIIKRTQKKDLILNQIPVDDPKTFDLLTSAQSIGVFQLESSGMRDILRKLRPDKFEDLIAVLALYRPGPIGSGMVDEFIKRKHGQIPIQYDHPSLEAILKDTYGIIVFQEQIMKIVNVLAGFSLGKSDSLRRAISKKKEDVMQAEKVNFVEGAVKHGVDKRIAEKIFNLIAHFAGYGFNKSHSAAYAMVSYETAYLKANYPVEFMTALLSSEKDNTDKIVLYIDEAKRMGIQVLPPDVNESFPQFTVVGKGAIRFGLAAVKNVGQTAIDSIIQARIKRNRFKSFFDFTENVDARVVNRKVIESLTKCGAFDSMGLFRSQLFAILDSALAVAGEVQKDRQSGQSTLFDSLGAASGFGGPQEVPIIPEWPEHEKLLNEKETLGFYVTGHPLARYQREIKSYSSGAILAVRQRRDGEEITVGGLVSKLKFTVTKKNAEKMAIVTVEDLEGSLEALVFPKVFKDYGHLLVKDAILFLKGRLDKREDDPKILVSEIIQLADARKKLTRALTIELAAQNTDEGALKNLQEVLSKYPGPTPVYLSFVAQDRSRSHMLVDRSLFVEPSDALINSLEKLVGSEAVAFR